MVDSQFNAIITAEGITYACQASTIGGWYLKPKRWQISDVQSPLDADRTKDSLNIPWAQGSFSGVAKYGANSLMHTIVVPPGIDTTTVQHVNEIAFIYEDPNGNEFLYALAQPKEFNSIPYDSQTKMTYKFLFTLNNVVASDTFLIDYTYPQDILDHNADIHSHDFLLARDGSRTATGKISYNVHPTFTNPTEIVDKKYVDDVTAGLNAANRDLSNLSTTGEAHFDTRYAGRALGNLTTVGVNRMLKAGTPAWDQFYGWWGFSSPGNIYRAPDNGFAHIYMALNIGGAVPGSLVTVQIGFCSDANPNGITYTYVLGGNTGLHTENTVLMPVAKGDWLWANVAGANPMLGNAASVSLNFINSNGNVRYGA